MFAVMRRPRWIAALLFALALATAFAFLGRWQLESSFSGGAEQAEQAERVVALSSVATPGEKLTDDGADQLVTVSGTIMPGSLQVIDRRVNEGEEGSWVAGFLSTEEGDIVTVALGWAPSTEEAHAYVSAHDGDEGELTITGRLLPTEAPNALTDEATIGDPETLSVAELINRVEVDPEVQVYDGFISSLTAPSGLTDIEDNPPSSDVQINWLNVFYAIEWVVFAGFAVFMWWRLVRDVYVREQEEAEEAAKEAVEHAHGAAGNGGGDGTS